MTAPSIGPFNVGRISECWAECEELGGVDWEWQAVTGAPKSWA